MTALESAARAYVAARESGRPTTTAYRRLRRAWVAVVRADSLLRELAEETTTVRYWPRTKPLPKGWKEAGPLHMPHGKYSRLIEKVK